jgi:Stress responsive A/B Barrel Domain
MIRHIVLFKLKVSSDPSEKQKAAEILKSELLSMRTKIPVIREFEIGINFNPDSLAFDVVINSVFENHEDLEIYRHHPAHQAFIAFNKNYSIEKVIADYVF